jgi:hypothetical protein
MLLCFTSIELCKRETFTRSSKDYLPVHCKGGLSPFRHSFRPGPFRFLHSIRARREVRRLIDVDPVLGLSLPGGVRLVTRTIHAVINWCFDCKMT